MRQLREIKSYLIVFKSFFNGQPTLIYIVIRGQIIADRAIGYGWRRITTKYSTAIVG